MAKENGEKTPSAEEIIEALALEMGVDDVESQAKDAGGAASARPQKKRPSLPTPPALPPVRGRAAPDQTPDPERKSAAAAAPDEKVQAPKATKPERPAAEVEPPKPEPKPARPKPPAVPAKAAELPTLEQQADELDHHGLEGIFSFGSPSEGDAYLDEYYEEPGALDDPTIRRGPMLLGAIVVAVITIIGLLATFLAIPEDKRQDVPALAKCWLPLSLFYECVNIQEQRQARREAEEERRLQEWLASLPKFGDLTVATTPAKGLFRVDDYPTYVEHPDREGMLVETRSGTTFMGLLADEHHVVVINLPNYEERRIELFPSGHPDSLWNQNRQSGRYFVEINELLEPNPELAAELVARATPDAETPELNGQITVATNPPGALVYYNRQLVTNAEGEPLLTPVTFSDYQPAPRPPNPEAGETEPVPRERRPVTLEGAGVPIRVELEGYLPVMTGVYEHMFACNGQWDSAGSTPFWEACQYTYDTGVIELMTPEEFHELQVRLNLVEEEEEEGTGEGVETAGVGTSG